MELYKVGERVRYLDDGGEGTVTEVNPYDPKWEKPIITVEWDDGIDSGGYFMSELEKA